jgi:ADP-ribose pyrophosphatase YjhB (NUDIX family)
MDWRIAIEPFTRPLFFFWSRLSRGKTLGVRVIARDADGGVMLVRHTYLKGWWLPGGGVDRGETVEDAAVRELREEAGLKATSRPRLLSIHSNERFFPGDHVLIFAVDAHEPTQSSSRHEIAEARFFPLESLPEDLNRGSGQRLIEYLSGEAPSPDW